MTLIKSCLLKEHFHTN